VLEERRRGAKLTFLREIHDELISEGKAKPHGAGFLGVVSYHIREPEDVSGAVELFRMSRRARHRVPGSSRSLSFQGRRRGHQAGTARR
jgi:hypothetical protein